MNNNKTVVAVSLAPPQYNDLFPNNVDTILEKAKQVRLKKISFYIKNQKEKFVMFIKNKFNNNLIEDISRQLDLNDKFDLIYYYKIEQIYYNFTQGNIPPSDYNDDIKLMLYKVFVNELNIIFNMPEYKGIVYKIIIVGDIISGESYFYNYKIHIMNSNITEKSF